MFFFPWKPGVLGWSTGNFTILGLKLFIRQGIKATFSLWPNCFSQQTVAKEGEEGSHWALEGQRPSGLHQKAVKHAWETLRMTLAHEKQNPGSPIPDRKKGPGSRRWQRKNSQEIKMRKILGKSPRLLPINKYIFLIVSSSNGFWKQLYSGLAMVDSANCSPDGWDYPIVWYHRTIHSEVLFFYIYLVCFFILVAVLHFSVGNLNFR